MSGYLVFYAPDNNGVYQLLSFTPDTTYVHVGVILTEGGLFYQVVAGTQPAADLRRLPAGAMMENVLSELR